MSRNVDNNKNFYVMIKTTNWDKGGGGRTLIHKMWMNVIFLLNPSLRCSELLLN